MLIYTVLSRVPKCGWPICTTKCSERDERLNSRSKYDLGKRLNLNTSFHFWLRLLWPEKGVQPILISQVVHAIELNKYSFVIMETFDIDVLPLGSRSDFLWSVGPYHPDCYKFSVSRTPEQIKSDVFESRRVQYIIEKVSGWIMSHNAKRLSQQDQLICQRDIQLLHLIIWNWSQVCFHTWP